MEYINKYFLYRHIRLDKNEPFYIGMGKQDGNGMYNRAYSKKSRNKIWNLIVDKSDYDVEILYESNNRDLIMNKEKEFIKMYGRIWDKTGTLSNYTIGGDGSYDVPPTVWQNRKATMIKNGTYQELIDRISKYVPRGKFGNESPRRTEFYVYNLDGIFYKKFDTKYQMCNELKLGSTGVDKYKNSNNNFFNYIFYTKNMGNVLLPNTFKVNVNKKLCNKNASHKSLCLIELKSGNKIFFNSMTDASLFLGYNKNIVSQRIRRNDFIFKGYKIEL